MPKQKTPKVRTYKTRAGAERRRAALTAAFMYRMTTSRGFSVMPYAPLGIPDPNGRYVVALMENGRVRAYCS